MNAKDEREEQLVLELLDAVGRKSDVSQRHLAGELGVALGLANSYLKRCIRKGFIKISEAPANRYLYYLTPKGFTEKSRLTAKYLSSSLAFYRKAAESCCAVYSDCREKGWNRVLLCGLSDLAEIAVLRAADAQIEIVGIYDPHTERRRFAGKTVWRDLADAEAHDACVLTDLNAPLISHQHLIERVEPERVMVPGVLGIGASGGA
jgi:DNA-binding MarR family transcriptional regulator